MLFRMSQSTEVLHTLCTILCIIGVIVITFKRKISQVKREYSYRFSLAPTSPGHPVFVNPNYSVSIRRLVNESMMASVLVPGTS